MISIHAPQWGATNQSCAFLSRRQISIHAPQWGATDGAPRSRSVSRISIHAPQWGATHKIHGDTAHAYTISIHAPQWGATLSRALKACCCSPFQSTHPSGVRPLGSGFCVITSIISIHAPQWGATPGPTGRGDAILFQSTHPSGVRLRNGRLTVGWTFYFNPRTPVGCDLYRFLMSETVVISIHAPQWGATSVGGGYRQQWIFQSTHPSGVRPLIGANQ